MIVPANGFCAPKIGLPSQVILAFSVRAFQQLGMETVMSRQICLLSVPISSSLSNCQTVEDSGIHAIPNDILSTEINLANGN